MSDNPIVKVFISGKYGGHDLPSEVRAANVAKAIDAARELIRLGFVPYCPHLSHWIHEGWGWEGSTSELWYGMDLKWLECCDAILMLDNWIDSQGAIMEKDCAVLLGMPIYYGLGDILL